ncbi:kinase-like domain-containing protein [Endogone sp. FLAS-F59071]|nr:kinase-like domain-containing protein [Endogone sp. FLAS-F59071]|eukprot:RUS16095.1 kinase-like domain-containing protein [Endogone sp. FLAS-F59071]
MNLWTKKFTERDPSIFARELVSTVLLSINSAKTGIKGAPIIVGISVPEFLSERYMVTDYAFETTLEDFPFEHHWKTVVQYALSIAKSLRAIHDVGLAHLSLRPANILLHEGEAHIINLSHHALDDSNLGSIKYFWPECYKQRDYPRENTQAADIFALGWVLWQLTTRVEPRILQSADEPWLGDELSPETPKEYADVIHDCWKEEPRNRPNIFKVLHRLNQIDQSKLSSILDCR